MRSSVIVLLVFGILALIMAIVLIINRFVSKTVKDVTVVQTTERLNVYPTGAIRRDGSNLSMINTNTSILFKKKNGEEFTLQVPEDLAHGLDDGVTGDVVLRSGKLISFKKNQ